jgi:hypothetical protein
MKMTFVCFPMMYFPSTLCVASLLCAFRPVLLYRFSPDFTIINWTNSLLPNQ